MHRMERSQLGNSSNKGKYWAKFVEYLKHDCECRDSALESKQNSSDMSKKTQSESQDANSSSHFNAAGQNLANVPNPNYREDGSDENDAGISGGGMTVEPTIEYLNSGNLQYEMVGASGDPEGESPRTHDERMTP